MPLLSPADQEKLREAFSQMTRPVRLLFFTQTLDCETCLTARQILDELPPLSDKIAIDEMNLILDGDRAKQYGVDRAPSIAIVSRDEAGADHDSRIRFAGTPAGYEFISLVQAVLLVGGGRESSLTDESRAQLAAVDRALTLQVFTTPT
jgi:alkyl hydroperoxide reductase subunit AhpF